MIDKRLASELSERIAEAERASPAQDIEKNLRAMLLAFFDRMDLVVREDFEVQKQLLERAQARLAALEARLAELEARAGAKRPG
ncbi:MAG: phosphoheptose isomerase [Betaproteobacteria bacterium RIFCSPLOWO2_12_FULL_68_20]|nr:MAG: phosphoheptose isomerase [Betaproteobacteria bacterium RIFCSPLOWO2_12_FULL_68_20]